MAHILVVDDDENIRILLRSALSQSGHTVVEASEGGAALSHLAAGPVDLIVTDLMMPGKEGLETIVEIRHKYPKLPVIAMSGGMQAGRFDFLPVAQKLGARITLAKPFSILDFLRAVDTVLAA